LFAFLEKADLIFDLIVEEIVFKGFYIFFI